MKRQTNLPWTLGVFFYLSLGLLISFLFFFSSNGMLNILHNFKDTILGSPSWIFQDRSKPKLKANDLQIICFSAPLNHCLKLLRKYFWQGHGVQGVSIPYSDGSKGKRLCRLRASSPRGFAARSRVLERLASLAQIGELARRLKVMSFP